MQIPLHTNYTYSPWTKVLVKQKSTARAGAFDLPVDLQICDFLNNQVAKLLEIQMGDTTNLAQSLDTKIYGGFE